MTTQRIRCLALGLIVVTGGAATAQTRTLLGSSAARVGGPVWEEARVIQGPGDPLAGSTQAKPILDFDVLTTPLGLGGDVVAGAPYSGDGVTEVVQTLADGNRIVRRSVVQMARDSAGRTRREQGLAVIGSWVGRANATHVTVTDPVEGVTFIIDDRARTVHKLRMPRPGEPATVGASAGRRVEVHIQRQLGQDGAPGAPPSPPPGDFLFELPAPPTAPGQGVAVAGAGEPTVMLFTTGLDGGREPHVESLGTQIIEGVSAEGTRATVVIPAGEIGNERELEIVTERWFSPELRTLVLSRHFDPRLGETVYRLTNIVRAEPSPSLFEVPADYTVTEGPNQRSVVIRRGERR